MSITGVPRILDRAVVLSVARAQTGRLGFNSETGDPVPVRYYAIAQYEGDEPRAYLFAVSDGHEVIGDSLWDSPAEAEQVALDSGHVSNRFEPPAA